MWLSFSRPLFLVLLLPAGAALWWSARISYADLAGARRWLAWVLRGALVLALIFALAGAQLVRRSEDLVVVFALDDSVSVSPEERARALDFIAESIRERRRGEDRGGLVVFGRTAAVESEHLRSGDSLQITSRPGQGHTNIAAGLRLSLGLLPPEAAGRVVLLSDGNENVGSAAQELLLAQANRVPIDVLPLSTRRARDVLVGEVRVPSQTRREEPFPVSISVEATEPAEVTLTLLVDDQPVETRPITLAAGASSLKIPLAIAEAGFHEIEVLVESEGQECLENDRGAGFVRVQGEPKLLLLDSNPEDAQLLAERLEAQDVVVEAAGPVALPTNVADLERYDAVYLSNLPAYAMDDAQMHMLRDATRDRGIGLGMIGGDLSFGAGGYYRTPVEEALPVDMDVTKNRVYPGAAVLIVMDTSGSMGAIEDGREKIELAAEAACAVVDLLAPYDSAGLIASDPRPTSICDLRKLSNKDLVKRDIRSVRAGGGGIACYPSLSAAYEVLRHSDASIRHIILLADGSDCDEQPGSVPLVAAMARERITTTAIAFGDGPHVPFLKDVARAGGGEFYLTEMARDLKKIFTRETLTVAKSVLVEEEFRPALNEQTAPVSGLDWSGAPPLLGYVASTAKPLANVPLLSHKDDPLFAHWQYGLGKSVAFTSDAKNHWAAHWLGWGGYSQFWGQAVRWSLRDLGSEVLYPRTELQGDTARVVVDAVGSDGSLLNGLNIRGAVGGPGGGREEVVLSQTAPGRYEGVVEAADEGAYVIGLEATGAGGFEARQTAGFEVGYPPDFAETRPQESFLRAVASETGGRVLADPAEAFRPPTEMPRVPQDIWRALLWLAAVLLPFDVAVRRLVIQREDLAAFTGPVIALLRRRRVRRAQEESTRRERLGRLLQAKEEARKRVEEETPPVVTIRREEATAPPSPTTSAPPEEPPPSKPQAPRADTGEGGDTTSRLLDFKRRRREEEE